MWRIKLTLLLLSLLKILNASVPLDDFFPHGNVELERGDDHFSPIIFLSRPLPFFGKEYRHLWLAIDGYILFTENVLSHDYQIAVRKRCLRNKHSTDHYPIVAPYILDLDTRFDANAHIYYRQTMDRHLLAKANADIQRAFPSEFPHLNLHWAFIATWLNVPHYNGSSVKNTFQAVITTCGRHSFAIFYSNQIGIDRWSNLNIPGWAGISYAPDKMHGIHQCSNRTSLDHLTDQSNLGIPGKWVVRLDNLFFPLSSPPSTTTTPTDVQENNCAQFEMLESNVGCGPNGYLLGFGREYCNALYGQWNGLDEAGRELVPCLVKSWMDAALKFTNRHSKAKIQTPINCTALWAEAPSKLISRYRKCPFCPAFSVPANRNLFSQIFSNAIFNGVNFYEQFIAVREEC